MVGREQVGAKGRQKLSRKCCKAKSTTSCVAVSVTAKRCLSLILFPHAYRQHTCINIHTSHNPKNIDRKDPLEVSCPTFCSKQDCCQHYIRSAVALTSQVLKSSKHSTPITSGCPPPMLHYSSGEKAFSNIQPEPPKQKKPKKPQKNPSETNRVGEGDLVSIWFGSLNDSQTKYTYSIAR